MVGPSMSEDDRRTLSVRVRAGFVLLVALSGALVAFQTGAGIGALAGGALGGGVVGYALIWYLSKIAPWDDAGQARRRR